MYPIEIQTFNGGLFGYLDHRGDYMEIGQVFEKLNGIVASRDLFPKVKAVLGVYYDDPDTIALSELKSAAGAILEAGTAIDPPLQQGVIEGGLYAILTFKGDYSGLHKAYKWLYGDWLMTSNHEPADRPPFEIYINSPANTAPDELITKIYLPIKP